MSGRGPAVALSVGLLAGTVLGRLAGARGGRAESYRDRLDVFVGRLGLNPGQREGAERALESRRAKVLSLRAEIRPRFDEVQRDFRAEFRALLTPEQAAWFDAFEAREDAERARRRAEREARAR